MDPSIGAALRALADEADSGKVQAVIVGALSVVHGEFMTLTLGNAPLTATVGVAELLKHEILTAPRREK